MPAIAASGPRRRVRVWFGEHVIGDYWATPELAERYAAALRSRFKGLRVTNEPLSSGDKNPAPLPAEHWWQVMPR
jgi:hypothetical protein